MKCFWAFGVMLCLAMSGSLIAVEVLTEINAPLSYEKNGIKKGLATEVVETLLKKAGISYVIRILPWGQAYSKAEMEPSVLLYPTAMTRERIQKFKWVGPITPVFYSSFIGLKGDKIHLKELLDAQKYRIGTVEGDYNENFLVQNGFRIEDIVRFKNTQELIAAIYEKKIDITLIQQESAYAVAQALKKDPKQLFGYLLVERQTAQYYLAISLETPDATVEKLKNALEAIKADNTYSKILSRYGFERGAETK